MTPSLPGRRRRRGTALTEPQLRTAWQLVSLLLDYPDQRLVSRAADYAIAAAALPAYLREPLTRFITHLAEAELPELQEAYVQTFDHTRRGCLYLTYATHGDTRRRGVALVRFKQAFRAGGLELTADELPDHISVVCEFGATADVDVAWRLLVDHRVSVELLRTQLLEDDSPWADVAVALSATLPRLSGDDADQLARLIAAGPPAEEVGLGGYGLDPRLNPVPEYLGATVPVGGSADVGDGAVGGGAVGDAAVGHGAVGHGAVGHGARGAVGHGGGRR